MPCVHSQFTIGQKKNEHLFLTNANTADLEHLAGLAGAAEGGAEGGAKGVGGGGEGKDGGKDDGGGEGGGGGGPMGGVFPMVQQVLPFTEEGVAEGFRLLKSRRVVGKLVFDMTNEVKNEVNKE